MVRNWVSTIPLLLLSVYIIAAHLLNRNKLRICLCYSHERNGLLPVGVELVNEVTMGRMAQLPA